MTLKGKWWNEHVKPVGIPLSAFDVQRPNAQLPGPVQAKTFKVTTKVSRWFVPWSKENFLENKFGCVAFISSLRCCGAC